MPPLPEERERKVSAAPRAERAGREERRRTVDLGTSLSSDDGTSADIPSEVRGYVGHCCKRETSREQRDSRPAADLPVEVELTSSNVSVVEGSRSASEYISMTPSIASPNSPDRPQSVSHDSSLDLVAISCELHECLAFALDSPLAPVTSPFGSDHGV